MCLSPPTRAGALLLTLLSVLGVAGTASGGGVAAQGVAGSLDGRSSRADYMIEARLDADTMMLDGRQTVTWTNRSADTVGDLWFHLYHNAFSNNRSTHLWESRGRLRGHTIEEGWGWQRVTALEAGGVDLTGSITFRAPDDARDEDRTVFSVDLQQPVGPGETLVVELEWEAQVPRVRRRTGYKDDFLLMAHWFPKLGVYEGGRGWNCHQFHMNTEFYADYGSYQVVLDLPANYADKVGTSGVADGTLRAAPGRIRPRFVAPSQEDQDSLDSVGRQPLVHGFAWTADPDFSVHEGLYRFDEWAEQYPTEVLEMTSALGVEAEALRSRDVRVRVMMQPERADQWQRHFDATCAALFFYGLWFGPYPYEQVTVVDPAWGGGAAGGMEYPTLFTCGTRLLTEASMYRPESVTVHECGHQFWYGLVGNNEFEAAWMDEGFNSYADSETLIRRYGPRRAATWYAGIPTWGVPSTPVPGGSKVADALAGNRVGDLEPLRGSAFIDWWRDQPALCFVEQYDDPRWSDRARYLGNPDTDPIDTCGWLHQNRSSYSTNSYPRTAVALRSLPAVVGREAFLRAMRRYSEEWRYRHPYPDDFFEAFSREAGQDVSWYFDDVFRGTGVVDWSVEVAQHKEPKRRGFFMNEEGEFVEHVEADDDTEPAGDESSAADEEEPPREAAGVEADDETRNQEPPAEADSERDVPVVEEALEQGDERPWIFDVVVKRKGTLRLPLVIEVTYADESKVRMTWERIDQDGNNWWRLPLEPGKEKIRSVVLDPERLWFLDANMSNNQWFSKQDEVAPLRWAERALTRQSHLFHWFSSIGG